MASAAAPVPAGSEIPHIWGDDKPAPTEVYFLTPIANVPSIMQHGILSNKRAEKLEHVDISNQRVQDLREDKMVPNPDRDALGKQALDIHRCANLYLRAHNAMMNVRVEDRDNEDGRIKGTDHRHELCVLRIDAHLLTRGEVVISSRNAARGDATFSPARDFRFTPQSAQWSRENSYAKDFYDKKAVQQAEVLVPYKVDPSFIRGAYVAHGVALAALQAALPFPSPISINLYPGLFFIGPRLTVINPIGALMNRDHPNLQFGLPTSSESEGDENDVEMAAGTAPPAPSAAAEESPDDAAPDTPTIPPAGES